MMHSNVSNPLYFCPYHTRRDCVEPGIVTGRVLPTTPPCSVIWKISIFQSPIRYMKHLSLLNSAVCVYWLPNASPVFLHHSVRWLCDAERARNHSHYLGRISGEGSPRKARREILPERNIECGPINRCFKFGKWGTSRVTHESSRVKVDSQRPVKFLNHVFFIYHHFEHQS
jgi:hypothetical protein